MKRLLLLFSTIFFLGFQNASATHIVGGELVYNYLGNSQYAVTLVIYRDCLSGTADFDDPAAVGIFNSSGTLLQNLNFNLDSVVSIQSSINSSCVTAPSNVCTEAGYYTEIVTLPPIAGGYTISYQRCCRNAVVQNIQNPGDVGATYVATIPGTESSPANSSPFWNNLPPLYVCVNLPWQFNHSAFDADGDVLVYSLCNPYEGATANAPQPDPPAAPPYTPITWAAPYSLTDMMGGTVPLTIDPVTGELNATPTSVGTYVIGMCVQEYRNGVLLGETRRGIQVNVVNCQAPVAFPDDVNEISPTSFINCTEFVEFNAFNSAGFSVWWDFGDPTTTSDQSTIQNPTWTYPGPGVYDLTLVVYNPINPNDPLCTDTVVQQVTVQDTVIPDAGPDQSTCPGIPVQIGTPAVPGWTYQWTPATGLDNANIAQPTASITQQIVYTLTATDAVGCSGSDAVTIGLLSNPGANAGADVQICSGDSVQLNATGGVDYLWFPFTFIDDNTIANPFVFPPTSTEYIVGVTSSDGCVGVDTVLVEVLSAQLQVSSNVDICFGDSTQLSASGAVTYLWSPNQDISDVNSSSPFVSPTVTTIYTVDAITGNGCEVSGAVEVTVNALPNVNAGLDVSICDGESTLLGAIGANSYTWSPSASLDNPNSQGPLASPVSTTTYVVEGTSSLGCTDLDTVVVTVNALPLVNAGVDQTLCLGQSVQLTVTGADTYQWTPSTGLSDSNIPNPTAQPTQATTYVVEGTDVNGCTGTDTVLVDVFTVSATADTTICIGDQAQLGAFGGTSWSWTPTTGLSDPSAQFPTADPTTTTTYTVIADDGTGCLASDDVTVTVSPLPTVFAGFDQGVCAGNQAQLNATGGVGYVWTPAAGLSNPNISNPVVTFSTDTITYQVTVTDNIGCSNTDAVTVWQEPLPEALAGPDTTICVGGSVELFATGGQTYIWSPTSGLNNPTSQNPTATPLTTTTYTVTVGQQSGNIVFNGDFSQGNVGFGSDYTYYSGGPNMGEGLYAVETDANAVHNAFQGTGHTGNAPQDSFMVVNGAGIPNQNVWCQTVSVSPNTDYYFGAWVSTMVASSPAILQFSINGQVLGSPFSAPFNTNNWVQFFQTWNSGNATTATICVVNQNTNTGGNDFGLDDITFSTFCTNTAEVTVTVNPLPQADAGADQAICIGETTQLEGSGGSTYEWVPPIGISDPTDPNTDASPITTTNYTLIVRDNIGCEATDQMTLTVNPLPQANAGPDHAICIGESVVLQGSGGTVYQWFPTTYLDDPTAQLPISTAEATTTYTLTVIDNNACVNTDQTTVTVNPLPIVDAGQDSMICANATIVLQASGANTYLWSPLVGLSDPQSASPSASPTNGTTYYVTGTDVNGCSNMDSVSIMIFGVAANSGDYVICLNDSVQATVLGGSSYVWTPTLGVSDSTSNAPYLSPETSTNYIISVTSAFGCLAETEVNVQVLSLPIAGFTAAFEPSCDGIFASFNNTSENTQTYSWNFGDGTFSSSMEPTHIYAVGSGNVVTLVAYNNDSLCVDSMTIDYSGQWFGNDSVTIDYSNVFTPNFDGINDCFKPDFDGRFSECYELKVYNRWGELLFESVAGQNHCWDGRTKGGNMVPEGTYYYISVIHGMDHAGYVTVIYQ
ncbi:MAG: gliding motility-associated C-terminal domain-containing protein [Flavobacteriales bacterium]|nr:gliding motility-associated C-terminal domain-containing protein [Flavobacteriales bacterium]